MGYYFLWLRWCYYELTDYIQHPLDSDAGYVDLRSLQRKWRREHGEQETA
jgi:hypothetical protein